MRHNLDPTTNEDFSYLDLKKEDLKKEPQNVEDGKKNNCEVSTNVEMTTATNVPMITDEKPSIYETTRVAKKKNSVKASHNCSHCDESFNNKKDLKKHKATHPEYKDVDKRKPWICDQCPYTSVSKTHLEE